MTAHATSIAHPDAQLLALAEPFRNAWAAERAAFRSSSKGFAKDKAIETAHDRCGELADEILAHRPVTLDGVKVAAMVWGWMYYLSEHSGEYEGADSKYPGDRAANAVMTFLLRDVSA
ncbi:MAG: hypothetical protein EOQ93_03140 [Mesorhizobium sp.]|nr:MAG: hypothetical protein EOQ93_03140 [Mesorhizobium sp.]